MSEEVRGAEVDVTIVTVARQAWEHHRNGAVGGAMM